jgi:hypothetical protein
MTQWRAIGGVGGTLFPMKLLSVMYLRVGDRGWGPDANWINASRRVRGVSKCTGDWGGCTTMPRTSYTEEHLPTGIAP